MKSKLFFCLFLLLLGTIFLTACAHKHELTDWQTLKEATCESDGQKAQFCRTCEYRETQIIPAHGHTPSEVAAKPATCTEEGKTEGSKCSECNTILVAQTIIPKKAHSVVKLSAVAATCSQEGKEGGSYCSVCKEVLEPQRTVPKTKHKEDAKGYCSVCRKDLIAENLRMGAMRLSLSASSSYAPHVLAYIYNFSQYEVTVCAPGEGWVFLIIYPYPTNHEKTELFWYCCESEKSIVLKSGEYAKMTFYSSAAAALEAMILGKSSAEYRYIGSTPETGIQLIINGQSFVCGFGSDGTIKVAERLDD